MLLSFDKGGMESYVKVREDIIKIGDTLEKNLSVLFYLTEKDNINFSTFDNGGIKIKFDMYKGVLLIKGGTESMLESKEFYHLCVKRKSPRKIRKELAKGLPGKELEVILKDFYCGSWWLWAGTIEEVFSRYSKEIFGGKGAEVKYIIERLAAMQDAIIDHFDFVEKQKSKVVKKIKKADSKLRKAVNITTIYVNNTEQFKKIFDILPEEKQKEVLVKIIQKGLKNEEADKWLNSKHADLVDKVGRDNYLRENGQV